MLKIEKIISSNEGNLQNLFHNTFGSNLTEKLCPSKIVILSASNCNENVNGFLKDFSRKFDKKKLKNNSLDESFFISSGTEFENYKNRLYLEHKNWHSGNRNSQYGEIFFLKGIIPVSVSYKLVDPKKIYPSVIVEQNYIFGINESWIPLKTDYPWNDDDLWCGTALIGNRDSVEKNYMELFGVDFPK